MKRIIDIFTGTVFLVLLVVPMFLIFVSIYLSSGGIKGLLLFNINDQIMAWEASCPNQYPSQCSTMIIEGVQSKCSCEELKYSLATGQILSNNNNSQYPMLLYYSEKNGNTIRISN